MVGAVDGSHALFARNGDTARSIARAHHRTGSCCLHSHMPLLPLFSTGFELGIKTMKPGGKRRIVVPPELGPPVSTQKLLVAITRIPLCPASLAGLCCGCRLNASASA